ncbi:hypothetical protein AUR61_014865 [Stutzerimonas balearica]|uniref:DUF4347 domain-containing protein n=1 Tax=Stutzerimonas balearica TaxID=74829 RepID=UPI0007731A95|nr:DUF4347 domain-containing protein [Stutzerimonas balearica]OMG63056.1 hypothetical protein AUR61_014865 [Stutzerimonas balearica]
MPSQQTQSLYFVDSTLADLDTLLAGLPQGAEVVLLQPDQDGLTQMVEALAGRSDIDALHVLTHGAPGAINLGTTTLDSATLADAAASLQTIGQSLSADADILFYGCNVAANEEGKALITSIAELSGADVAASEDLTGASQHAGDWDLEASTGAIEAAGITAFNFDGILALPGAHSATQSGEVFLGGNYIELGISAVGSFGTTGNKPGGFFGTPNTGRLGMSNDADGFSNGKELSIDYFLPGSPEERWAVGYNGSTTGGYSALSGQSGAALTGTSLTNASSGDTLAATFSGTVGGTLKVEQTHSFKVNDKFFKTVVTLTNTSGSTLTDVRFMRSFDPDNTVFKGGSYDTVNKVEHTFASGDGKAVVSATSKAGDSYSTAAGSTAKILFFSSDSRANVANFGFSNSNPYAMPVQNAGYTNTSDSGIAIMFKGGTLAAGASVTFEYFTSLDTANIADTIAAIEMASNPAPTFTAFAAPVDTVAEDTQVEISFADLAAQGNEADQQPNESGGLVTGTVDAFVVTSVTSGTLKIGSDAASATAWNPGTNDVIDATKKAYWTPAGNANGTLNAFKVVARDSDGLKSASPVQAQVAVTAVNDAPVIASSDTKVSLLEIKEDQASINGASVTALFEPRFTDVDAGASLGGIIVVNDASTGTQGTWQYSLDGGTTWTDIGTVSASEGLALSASTLLRFNPEANWHGTPGELTVRLTDNAYTGGYTTADTRNTETSLTADGVSTNSINLATKVASVNDLPYFTSVAGAATLGETADYDSAVTTDSGALTGTLAGGDVEGAVSFSIRGGSTSGNTVTKEGFYGTLTLNTDDNSWSYTPTNFAAINALAQGATANDSFDFKIVDSDGASVTQALTITYTGTNDLPVLKADLADQEFNGNGTWVYQLPAHSFADAEGLGLTYSVEVVDGSGNVIDTIGATTNTDVGNVGKPSYWLTFDEASRSFTGNPAPSQLAQLPLNLKVTATDSAGEAVTDTFTLTLNEFASDANPLAPNIAPTTTDDHLVVEASGSAVTLTVNDFGTFSDANGDGLASVKILTPPSGANGTLKIDGVAITEETTVTVEDINANKLTFEPGTTAATIGFQVGDGNAFSSSHTLAIDVGSSTAAVTFDPSSVTTAVASSWTSVYSDNAEVLSGYTGTVRVVVEATGGNVRLSDASGVTAATGYGSLTDGTATSIAFEGTLTQVNAALQQLQANLASNPSMTLDVSAIAGGPAFNPDNQHYYQYVESTDITWTDAKAAAEASTFNGLKGYLATVTSAEENTFIVSKVGGNAWIGASDSETEGTWKWVGGPEGNQTFFTDTGSNDGTTGTAPFYSWQTGEPNDDQPDGADYAQIITDSSTGLVAGRWNDLPDVGGDGAYTVTGYVVEYGGTFTDSGTVTEQASRSITLTKLDPAPVLSIGGNAAYTENAQPKILAPALDITDIDSTTLASATVTIGAGKVTGDQLGFTNNPATMGNILATFNAASGVLTLASAGASATLAQWEAALQSVTFTSTSDAPGTSRTLQWLVTDSDNNTSTLGSTSINVTEVNDAPKATGLPDVELTAGSAVDLSVGDVFSDPEDTAITYSAEYLDANGDWQTVPATTDSYWLSFDPATRKFAGNPPAGLAELQLKVIGSDGSASAESTFTLNLGDADAGVAAENNTGSLTISDNNGGSVALGDTLTASAPTDDDGYTTTDNLRYQWQSKTSDGDWEDINGATASTYTITQAESGRDVRAQAFYLDNGGFAEAPVSNVLAVPTLDVTGIATISGSLAPGQAVVATLQDGNGLSGATPTYTWYRGDTAGAKTTVVGGNFSAYTLTNDDGGKFITVEISYTDDEGTVETVSDTTDTAIQLGAVAPVAVNDAAVASEASGVNNGVAGSNGTGNLFGNDTDANTTDSKALVGLRSGSTEGMGEIGLLEGGEYIVTGLHGTLRVNAATGAYTYVVNQDGFSVQAMNTGDSIKDTFNYSVADGTGLTDIGVLEVTINGANDAPTVRDLPTAFAAVEDSKTALTLPVPFALSDVDSTGAATVKLVASEGKLSGADAGGVTVTGSESGTLTLSGTLSAINTWLKTADTLFYTSAPNDNGDGTATIRLLANDGASGDVQLAEINVNVSPTNDAPTLDLNADNSTAEGVVPAGATGADLDGNDHAVVFRPRGESVQVVDEDITIGDIDGDTTLVKAVVEITAGAWDNTRTIYETLSSTAGSAVGSIAITGNGTGTNGLVGATRLTLTGEATHAQYQAALKTVVYNNSNENAFAGNRSITVAVFDKESAADGLESNAGSFTIGAANAAIAVGQKIYIGGEDTGHTVAQVVDNTHFVASGPLPTMADSASLAFWLDGAQVTTATATAPLAASGYAPAAATTTVQVIWTPVVDLNGNAAAGTVYTTSYTEGASGTYISSTDALITDQDGNLKTVTVTLDNAVDGDSEVLFLAPNIVSNLAANGITTTFYDAADNVVTNEAAGTHKIVFSGNKDATTFQQGLRGVQYKNTSEDPGVTPRKITTAIVDQDNNDGISATSTVNIVPVNDAPVLGGDGAASLAEGAVYVFTGTDFASTDVDDNNATLKYVLTDAPDHGTLFRDTNNNGRIDAGEAISTVGASSTIGEINAIGSSGYFTQGEIDNGRIKYLHDGSETTGDSFGFKLADGGEDAVVLPTGSFALTVTPVNDAPEGQPVISGTLEPGQTLTVDTSAISDGDGPAVLDFSYQWKADGIDIGGATSNSYTLTGSEAGKTITVAVRYTDTGAFTETLLSSATDPVALTNSGPSGAVAINGTAQAGETLVADTSGITDADGLGAFGYQWQVSENGTDWTVIDGATAATFALLEGDVGKQFRVAVSYTDGRGTTESLTSSATAATSAVTDVNNAPYLAAAGANPTSIDGSAVLYTGVSATTVEAGQLITGLTLEVSGLQDGIDELLLIDGQAVALTDGSGTTDAGDIGYTVTVSGTTATLTLSHAGLDAAQAQALVGGLTYRNTKVDTAEPPASAATAGLRVITLTGITDDGGTSASGKDTAVLGISSTVNVGEASNTAPTVAGDLAAAVNEGATVVLTLDDLTATDTEHPVAGLTVQIDGAPAAGTLFLDANTNGRLDDGEELGSGDSFTLADVDEGRVLYAHGGADLPTDSFTYIVGDGLSTTAASTFNITVTGVNDAPVVTATASNPAYVEGAAPGVLFNGVTASPGEADQDIESLTLMISGLRDGAAETLVVDGASVGLTNGTGTTATNSVGYTVSLTGGTATVTLNKLADSATWAALINGLAYANNSDAPTVGERQVTLVSVKDDGGTANGGQDSLALGLTSRVSVSAVDDAPVLTGSGFTVGEGGSFTLTTAQVSVTDPDTAASVLRYTLETAPSHGTLYLDSNGNAKADEGEDLAADGQFTHAQLAAGKVRYEHDGSEEADSLTLSVTDGNSSSTPITLNIERTAANDAPSLVDLGSDILTYPANSGAKLVEQGGDLVVSDPDSSNFNGGSLRVAISFNRDPVHDTLTIANQGTDSGQISVTGNSVSYGVLAIGTFKGGTGTQDLLVNLNSNATPEAVSALVKAIQFSNDQESPAATSRAISFTLNDGAADGLAAPVSVNVNILTGVTPSISIANGFFVVENSQLVTALSAVDPNNRPITFSISNAADATNNPDNGQFEIVSGNLLRFKAAPDFEAAGDSGGNNVYNVIVRATNDQGSYAEQALAITVLDQAPEGGAVGDTDGPAFGYATVSGRSLVMTYTDASPLSAANQPNAAAFTVKVGGTVVAVNSVAINATTKTVSLTLASAVSAGQSVTVSYTDPTAGNDTQALQDAAGNDAASFIDATVSNITPGGSTGGGTTTPTTPTEPTTPTTPPAGTITGGTTTTGTGDDGSTTTTTTGTIGTVRVTETVVVTRAGETIRELVYVPTGTSGGGTGGSVSLPLLYENIPGSDSNTTITLPDGVGLKSVGDRTPTGSAKALDLIELIQTTVSTEDPSKGSMLGGGQSFLDQRSADSTLWINKIELTSSAGAGTPASPIVIDGAANNSSSSYTGDKLEALVIDASQLPSGSTLELQNVDFAVVLGDGVIVRGGNGANVVYGGDGAQNIVLGADDDVLYGGAGNDTVGSEGGADQLFGNSGNDTMFGGAGSDLLHGGADTDVAVYSGNINRYEITRDNGKTIVRSLDRLDDIDTLVNLETIRFDDAEYRVENQAFHTWIATLYQQVLGRQADLAGFQYWSEEFTAGKSLGALATYFLYSAEYEAGAGNAFATSSQSEQVDMMYQYILGRAADEGGKAYWTERMAAGISQEAVAQAFVESAEMQSQYLYETGWEFLL